MPRTEATTYETGSPKTNQPQITGPAETGLRYHYKLVDIGGNRNKPKEEQPDGIPFSQARSLCAKQSILWFSETRMDQRVTIT